MLREVLIGEAMHALGIPTTRALAVVATGEPVLRETGRCPAPCSPAWRPATCAWAPSSTSPRAANSSDAAPAGRLHDRAPRPRAGRRRSAYLALLRAVAERQAALVAQWMHVGFIHGVMNTDNMTISGETIDYGPCAFMEAYRPAAPCSAPSTTAVATPTATSRSIARWNLARLAETLLPLMADGDDEAAVQQAVAQVTEVIDAFPALYRAALLQGQRAKLGLQRAGDDAEDESLAEDWLALLHAHGVDFTLAWRRLADAAAGDEAPLRALFADPQAPQPGWTAGARAARPKAMPPDARAADMRAVNPLLIPRNHRVEEALAAASEPATWRRSSACSPRCAGLR